MMLAVMAFVGILFVGQPAMLKVPTISSIFSSVYG